ncbi:hypothetical protein L596_009761 [Steinernema carpocapsae]|uniref:Uncharacterized protein n=1 Tax=Steinernema carpocapsae TaxID=34508 RepID=A0A4U5PGL5_STECR|nr:hypothetical protein L596_009761 [Steinernema carpocapsae]
MSYLWLSSHYLASCLFTFIYPIRLITKSSPLCYLSGPCCLFTLSRMLCIRRRKGKGESVILSLFDLTISIKDF